VTQNYPKPGQFGKREMAPGKSTSEQSLMFGETAQLPGGLDPMRKYTRDYGKTASPAPGPTPPASSLSDP
jgi:hypothetical protein